MTDSGVLNMTSPRKNLGPMHIVSIPSRSSIYSQKPSSPIQKKEPGDGVINLALTTAPI
jgi:hypothetical protein